MSGITALGRPLLFLFGYFHHPVVTQIFHVLPKAFSHINGFSSLSLLFLICNLFSLCFLLSISFSSNKRKRETSSFQTSLFCWWQLWSTSCSDQKTLTSSVHSHNGPVSNFYVSTFKTYPKLDHTLYNVHCHQPAPSHHLYHLDYGSSISSDPPASTPACVRVTVNLAAGVILWKQCGFDRVTQLLRVLSWFSIFLRL